MLRIRRLVSQFTTLGQPAPKARPRVGRHGNVYTPRETLVMEHVIGITYRQHAPRGYPPIPREYDIELEVDFFFKDKRYGDIDNCLKLVQDGLNGIAYVDDKQVAKVTMERHLDRERPRTEVRVYYREETP